MVHNIRQLGRFLRTNWPLRIYAGVATSLIAGVFYWGPLSSAGQLSLTLPVLCTVGFATGAILLPQFMWKRDENIIWRVVLVYLGGAATFIATGVLFHIAFPIVGLVHLGIQKTFEGLAAGLIMGWLAIIVSPLLSPIGGFAALVLELLLVVAMYARGKLQIRRNAGSHL